MTDPPAVPPAPAPAVADRVLQLLREGEDSLQRGAGRMGLETVQRACSLAHEAGDPRLLGWSRTRLGSACEAMGRLEEAVRATSEAVNLFTSCGEHREAAIALYCLGYRQLKHGLVDEAEASCLRAARLAHDLGAHEQEGHALVNLGHVYLELQRLSDAETCYGKARQAFGEAGNQGGVAASLNSSAGVLRAQGRVDEALQLHREALALARGSDTWTACYDALMNLGEIQFTQGGIPASRECFREALAMARHHGQPLREVMAERNLAVVSESSGDLDGAAQVYLEAHATLEALEDRAGCAEMLRLYINACKRTSTPERGLACRRRALKLARAHLSGEVVLELLDNVAEIAFRTRQWSMALDYWENALRLARRLGHRERETTCLEHLRYIYQQSGRADLALEPAQDLVELHSLAGATGEQARILLHLSEIWLAMAEPLMASGVARKGLALLESHGEDDGRLEAGLRGNLANALLLMGEPRDALDEYERVLALFRRQGDLAGQGVALANMGTAWRLLGDGEQAERCSDEGARCLVPIAP